MGTTVDDQPTSRRERGRGRAGRLRTPGSGGRRRARRRPRWRPAPMLVRLSVAVVLPILASTVMALSNGWTPVGDNATLALRTGDVVRGHPPLVGMPSTADTITDTKPLDHPGPMEVFLAAPAYAVLGPIGLLLTVAAVNAAALVVAVSVGWRRGRAPMAVAIAGTGLLLCWSLGTTVIRDPLNSHAPLLPWFAVILLCWDVRLGHWRSLPVAVAFASWSVQAHVVYTPLVLVLAAGTVAACVVDHRRRTPEQRRRVARGRRRSLAWAGAVGGVLSLPMVIDQFWGEGNLGRMLGFTGQPGLGLSAAVRTTICALGFPPAWLRPINDPFILLRGPGLLDLLAFSATIGLIAWVLATAVKRKDRQAVALVQLSLVGLLGMVVAVARTPKRGAVLAADPMLLMRPVTALVWLAAGWGVWRTVEDRAMPLLDRPRVGIASATVGAVAALALVAVTVFAPAKFGGYGEGLMAPIARVEPKVVSSVDGQRLVQVNATGWAARLYLRHTLMERLEREGVPTRTGDKDRAFRRDGDSLGAPSATLWVVSDPVKTEPPAPGAFLIATTEIVPGGPLSGPALRRRRLRDALDGAGRVTLRSTSRLSIADISREYFRWTTPPPDQSSLPAEWISVDAFVDLQRNGLVASPTVDDALVDQIYRDSIGRFFAADDTQLSIYLRIE